MDSSRARIRFWSAAVVALLAACSDGNDDVLQPRPPPPPGLGEPPPAPVELCAQAPNDQLCSFLPQDVIVEKMRYSAFIQGSSNIEEVLRARGLDTLLITGTVTNVCCESTARDAMMRNFKTIMVTDGNAANTDEDHNAALGNFYLTFGDIMSTDFAIGCLTRNAQKGLAAAE